MRCDRYHKYDFLIAKDTTPDCYFCCVTVRVAVKVEETSTIHCEQYSDNPMDSRPMTSKR